MTNSGMTSRENAPRKTASRIAPVRVQPIDIDEIRYEAVWGTSGLFRASEIESSKVLWERTLYRYKYDDTLEADVQDVFVSAMDKESLSSILVTDERRKVYRIDLKSRTSRIVKWPVALRLVTKDPLTVELVLTNNTDRVVQFAKPSIGFGEHLANDLFRIKADGVEIPYRGMMGRRMLPADFLKLTPLETFRVKVDLSKDYEVSPTAKKIEVHFEHTNHFFSDDFQLYSPHPLLIE